MCQGQVWHGGRCDRDRPCRAGTVPVTEACAAAPCPACLPCSGFTTRAAQQCMLQHPAPGRCSPGSWLEHRTSPQEISILFIALLAASRANVGESLRCFVSCFPPRFYFTSLLEWTLFVCVYRVPFALWMQCYSRSKQDVFTQNFWSFRSSWSAFLLQQR